MKSIKHLSLIGLLIIIIINSCTIEKRIYSSGYHVDWKNCNPNSNKKELVKDNLGKQPEQKQNVTTLRTESVINTFDNAPKVIDNNIIKSNVNERIYLSKKEKNKFHSFNKVTMSDKNIKNYFSGKLKIINDILKTSKNTDTESKMSVMAIAGFICSFLGLLLLITIGFPLLFGTLGTILSAIGLNRISKNGKEGKGLATAGLVIGILTVLIFWGVLYALFTSLNGINNVPF